MIYDAPFDARIQSRRTQGRTMIYKAFRALPFILALLLPIQPLSSDVIPLWTPEHPEVIEGNLMIIPKPFDMIPGKGDLTITEAWTIVVDSFPDFAFDPFKIFNEVLLKKGGYSIPGKKAAECKGQTSRINVFYADDLGPEAYKLQITTQGIVIHASGTQGVFYAMQSLRQIMRMDALSDAGHTQRHWKVPAVDITDTPRFAYRGMHLDVCRHIMPLAFVEKYIDLLAFYKMNRFHWHLTDDQGWRIEIKKYPKLQEVAAWRKETLIGHYSETPDRYDGKRYGGYYTQDQIREVVAYAAERGVTIIPEIEMPGHALAALSAYPELACTPGPFEAATTWGVFEDVFCPNEETFTFLENVLDEVMALFPSPYIHIGGDECPKDRWKESAFCQQLIKDHALSDEHGLQS